LSITAEQVRELRERTGAGFMDCKRALEEAGGDQEKAIAILREKGLATAAKKAGRLASEGLVASFVLPDRTAGALVEVNCETDFVAKNEEFVAFVRTLAEKVAKSVQLGTTTGAEGEILRDLALPDGTTVAAALTALIAKIGENMTVRRFARFAVPAGGGLVESYIHMGGKIGVLVELSCRKAATMQDPRFLTLARDLAMQVAAARPEYVRREEVPAATIENERGIYRAQALNEGKPEQVAEKIVAGRLEKFFKDVCLLEQIFIKDNTRNCAQVIKSVADELGEEIAVVRFARFERGEGLAKKEEDFLAAVRAQIEG